MAQAFNLVARLQLQGPQNINQIVNRIQSRLNNLQANIALNLPANANTHLRTFNNSLTNTSILLQQVTTNANAASAALANVATQTHTTNTQTQRSNAATQQAATHMTHIAKSAKVAGDEMQEFGRISALAVRRFLAFSIPAGILVGLTVNIKKGVKAAIDFERELIRVQQVTGRTREGLSGLTEEIGRLAQVLGASSGELVEVSRTLAQAGLTARQTKIALTAIAKTDLSPTFDSMKQTTEGAIAAMRQFNIAAEAMEAKLGSINAVAGSFAVESADIISAIRRTGGAFKAAGGNLEELIALFTSVRSTTRESADSIATGFRTIFTRIQRPRTIQFLREFGIELQNLDGKFVGPYRAVQELNRALKQLDPRDVRFSRITEELGGFRQVSKVIPLVQQFAVSQQALQVAMAGTKSVTEDATLAQGALAIQIAKVGETWNKLYRDIVGSNTFKFLATTALSFAQSLADVLRYLKDIAPLLITIGGIQGLSVLRRFGTGFVPGVFKGGQGAGGVGARRFARGGTVPGTGSGDTVPAMLQPGEFVLRKSAAQAIGHDKLQSMNVQKFAKGGPVRRVRLGLASLFPSGRGPTHVGAQTYPASEWGGRGPLELDLTTQSVSKKVGQHFQRDIFRGLVDVLKRQADTVVEQVGGGALAAAPKNFWVNNLRDANLFPSQTNTHSTLGKWFEAVLTRLGDTSQFRPSKNAPHGTQRLSSGIIKQNPSYQIEQRQGRVNRGSRTSQPIDFIGGIKSKQLMVWPGLTGIPLVDAKRSDNTRERQSVYNKGLAYLSRTVVAFKTAVLTRKGARGLVGGPTHITPFLSQLGETLSAIRGTEGRPGTGARSKWIQTIVGKKASYTKEIDKLFSKKHGLTPLRSLQPEQRSVLSGGVEARDRLAAELGGKQHIFSQKSLKARLKELFKGTKYEDEYTDFARGGLGSTTDTIPAMLTPGEFVFNKEAAQKIGYDNLNNMNKEVKGYAAGGMVGNIGSGAGGRLFGIGIIASFASSMADGNEKLQDLISTVTKLTLTFEGVRVAMGVSQSIAGQLGVGKKARQNSNPILQSSRGRIGAGHMAQAFYLSPQGTMHTGPKGARGSVSGPRPRLMGKRSSFALGTRALTGFGVATLAATGAAAAASVALIYLGGQATEQANEMAKTARTQQDMNRALDKANKGSVLSKAGYGAALGGGIGAAFGPWGIAIGALGGAIVGAISGYFVGQEKRANELRKANRESRFTESSESLGDSLEQLLSGNINVRGSTALNTAGTDIANIIRTIKEASAAGDSEEVLSRTRGLKGSIPQFDQLKTKLIDAGAGLDEFTRAGSTGAAIVDAFALAQKKSTYEIRQAIESEINARSEAVAKAKEFESSVIEMTSALRVLREFGSALADMTSRIALVTNSINVSGNLARGQVATGGFVGMPGLGDFARVGTEGIGNRAQFSGALGQMFGGALGASTVGQQTQTRLQDLATMIDEIPSILSEISREPALSKDNASARFSDVATERFAGLSDSANVIKMLESGIESFLTAQGDQGGVGQFAGLGRTDPQELANKLGLKELNKNFEEADKVAKGMLANVKSFESAIELQTALEIEVYKRRLKMGQQAFMDAQAIVNLSRRGGDPTGVDVFTQEKRRNIQATLTGTRAAGVGSFDTVTQGNKLREVNAEIKALQEHQQSLAIISEEFLAAKDKLGELNVEASKLRSSLESLKDITAEAAAIQQTLNALEEQKKARFAIADQYTYGSQEDRQKILQSIRDALLVNSGAMDIDRLSGERRGGVGSLNKQFQNVRALFAGIDPKTGEVRTGGQADAANVTGRISRIPVTDPRVRALFGGGANLDVSDSDPTKLNAAEKEQIAQMQKLFDVRAKAELELLQNMETNTNDLTAKIKTEFENFNTTLVAELTRIRRNDLERQRTNAQQEKDAATTQQKKLVEAQGLAVTAGAGDTSLLGSARLANAISSQSIAIDQGYQARAAGDFFGQMLQGQNPLKKITGASGNQTVSLAGFDTGTKLRAEIERVLKLSVGSSEAGIKTNLLEPLFTSLSGAGVVVSDTLKERLAESFASASKDRDIVQPKVAGYTSRRGRQIPHFRQVVTQEGGNEFVEFITRMLATELTAQGEKKIGDIGVANGATSKSFIKLVDTQRDQMVKLSASFKSLSDEAIPKLEQTIDSLGKTIETVDTAITQLGGGPVETKALGGPMFKRQGTDTVPAMLTPGEFVVNRAAAQKNMGLLHAINRGSNVVGRGGTQYAAAGGYIEGMNYLFDGKPAVYRNGGFLLTGDDTGMPRLPLIPTATSVITTPPFQVGPPSQAVDRAMKSAGGGSPMDDSFFAAFPAAELVAKGVAKGAGAVTQGIFSALGIADRGIQAVKNINPLDLQTREKLLDQMSPAARTAYEKRQQYQQDKAGRRASYDAGKAQRRAQYKGQRPRTRAESSAATKTRLGQESAATQLRQFDARQKKVDLLQELKDKQERLEGTSSGGFNQSRINLLNQQLFGQQAASATQTFDQRLAAAKTRGGDTYNRLLAQRERADKIKEAHRFHYGGMVPGSGNQPAILEGGELVVSKANVQALAKGGPVKGYQAGGDVTTGGGSMGPVELVLSSDAKSTITGMSEALKGAGENIRAAFVEVPGQIEAALASFPAKLDSSAQIMGEAASKFASGAALMQTSAAELPASITTALNEAGTTLGQVFEGPTQGLKTAAESLGQGVTQLATVVTDMATAVESMRGAATDIRDALAQEVQINVTHTHEPITVTVEGGETTVQDGDSFSELVMEVVGPQIDALRDRIRETGFGIA